MTGKKGSIGRLDSACRLAIRVKAGATGCNITCPEMDETMADAAATYHTGVTGTDKKGLFEGEQSNPDKEYDADGNMYLTWYVQISNKCLRETFNFTLTNQLNSQDDYITHFQLRSLDPRLNPLWYVSKYYLNSDLTFNTSENNTQGYLFKWSTIMGKGYTNGTSSYSGYALPATPKTVSNGESGVTWHLPTPQEWRSVAPVQKWNEGNDGGIFSNTSIPANTLYTEIESTFGYNNATKYKNGTDNSSNTGIAYRSYWSVASNVTRYAIRFIGTDYVSVWKYQIINDADGTKRRLVISSRLIDPITEAELSTKLSSIESEGDSFWADDEDKGDTQRVFYYTGHTSGTERQCPGDQKDFNGNGTYIWSTYNEEPIGFMQTRLWWYGSLPNYALCVRLFRDN